MRPGRRTGCVRPPPSPSASGRLCAGPIWIRAARTISPGTTLRAMAPAATRAAVSRAEPAAAAAIIVDAVFDVIGVAGVARPIGALNFGVVLRALIDVLDHQRDRRAGGDAPGSCSPSRKTPERIFTVSGSRRWVVKRDCPGRRPDRGRPGCRLRSAGSAAGSRRRRSRSRCLWLSPERRDAEEMPECVERHCSFARLAGVVTRACLAGQSRACCMNARSAA